MRAIRTAPWLTFMIPLFATGAVTLYLLAAGPDAWPGAPDPCVVEDACYCEAFRPGAVKQPVNTWSCLVYMLVGFLLTWDAAGEPEKGRRAGRIPLGLFATAVALIGPASMVYHASMTRWGALLDGFSMDLLVSAATAFGATRRRRLGQEGFLAGTAGFLALLTGAKWILPHHWLAPLFAATLLAVFLLETLPEGDTAPEDLGWLWKALGLLAAAFTFWILSRTTTSPLCRPESLLQPHALWHLLCALAGGALYMHYRAQPATADD